MCARHKIRSISSSGPVNLKADSWLAIFLVHDILFTFPFPYPLKNNFPLYDLHCVTTLRIQNYVDCNICVVPLLKASIRSTAPQTEQHSQSTEPLDKMPQCRKMSNVSQRRLVTVRRLTGSFIGCYKYDKRQDNHNKMVFGSFFYGKLG